MNIEINWPPKFVRIRKIAEVADPISPALPAPDYPYGQPTSAGSLPVQYTIDGWLLRLPVPGEPVRILRIARNDVVRPGVYTSSEVVYVSHNGIFTTQNSIYHWQEIGRTGLSTPVAD